MQRQRAEVFAQCAASLSLEQPGCEALFDQALTNGLAAIVAHEWPGEEKDIRGRMLPASGLLKVITSHLDVGESGVYVIPEPSDPQMQESMRAIFGDDEDLCNLDTTIDVATLTHALQVTQPVRHARGPGELERRHIDALLALDDHPSLRSLNSEHADREWVNAKAEDEHSVARALRFLELIGEEEADRRALHAENPNEYHPKHNPEGTDLTECPVCGRETFCVQGCDDWGYGFGYGQCMVCTYTRSSSVANDMAFDHHLGYQLAKDD